MGDPGSGDRARPLTVLTVYQAIPDYWGTITSPGVHALAEEARKVAQEEADRLLDEADAWSRPPLVTVQAVNGLPAKELLKAADDTDADMIVLGARGAAAARSSSWPRSPPTSPPRALPRRGHTAEDRR